MTPATDCPPCPACGLPCGTRDSGFTAAYVARQRGADWLSCAACGHVWQATAAELEQAARADAAWREQMRGGGA